MKEAKSIDPKLLEGLDDKALEQIRQALSAETEKRKAEKQAKKKRKAEYTLIVPVRKYRQDHQMMWLTLLEKLNAEGSITLDEAKSIERYFTDAVSYELPEVYPCPECVHMRLYAGNYSEGHRDNKFAVSCDRCSFRAPFEPTKWDAWDRLHVYLKKRGFIPHNAPKPDESDFDAFFGQKAGGEEEA